MIEKESGADKPKGIDKFLLLQLTTTNIKQHLLYAVAEYVGMARNATRLMENMMHIEPGYVTPIKIMAANVVTVSLLGFYVKQFLTNLPMLPVNLLKMLLAAGLFSIFMQSFHMPVGPSELHFVGAMAIYLTLGFVPTLIGFTVGLTLQGLLFNPADLAHLSVNSLSLMLPLITVHLLIGRHHLNGARSINIKQIVKLDAAYYSGVTGMVGFWLMLSDMATPFSAWMSFAASYLVIVLLEPLVTFSAIWLLKKYDQNTLVTRFSSVHQLRLESKATLARS